MIGKHRIWDIKSYSKEKAGCLAAELGISPLVTGILLERGYNDVQSMHDFLYGAEKPFHNPFLLKDMEKTVERIRMALQNKEQIVVYGDYDVDGITASSLLYLYLRNQGACVSTYIPQRKSEGYGLNDDALKTIAAQGATLVITVDCGISGLHEVSNAPKALDIIITDHHTVPDILPPAYAIVNPKQADCKYPFKDLSGVGVAFKLCQALEQKVGQNLMWQQLTELVALGTVADIVPLVGENREIVRRGLKAMETTSLAGLKALMKVSGCPQSDIVADNIGFGLAPRLNAVGRLEHAQLAVELLVTEDEKKAELIAEELNHENALRQEISRQIMQEAEAQLAQLESIDTAIILASEGWHQGVIGIVASRLVEKYHLPTLLFSINDNMAKGSCRSIPALNLYEAIAAESDLLTQFGGHHQAAGLTLPASSLPEFRRRFREYVQKHLQKQDYQPHQNIDCFLSDRGEITIRDVQELALLEPCGCCNQSPVFAFHNALLHNQRAMGRDRTHLQFYLAKQDYSYRCIMWNSADLLPFLFDNMIADVAFQPKINVWNNEINVQLQAVSIHQQLYLADLRQSFSDKWQVLKNLLQMKSKVYILVNCKQTFLTQENCQLAIYNSQIEVLEYKNLTEETSFNSDDVAIFWDIPFLPLKDVVMLLKDRGLLDGVLLFNHGDNQFMQNFLNLHYPDRNTMVVAYKSIMAVLGEQENISWEMVLKTYPLIISEETIKIMQELGFITCDNGIIKKGVIKRCALENSPLYTTLQKGRLAKEACYKENLQMSQHEILRG